tara:strand:- start:3693 stop:4106 length:414 start_codon:yes stop_codon:yes gene_type:complete
MKILISLILLLSTSEALAGFSVVKMSIKERQTRYWGAMEITPDKEKIFIRGKTIECDSDKGMMKMRNLIFDGGTITRWGLRRSNCSLVEGSTIGIVAGVTENTLLLVYRLPGSDKNIGTGFFYKGDLMTLEDRKKMN